LKACPVFRTLLKVDIPGEVPDGRRDEKVNAQRKRVRFTREFKLETVGRSIAGR